MPFVSKYTDQQIESILSQLLQVLENNQATAELSLMCLGNSVSHIIGNLNEKQKKQAVENFCAALKSSIDK